MKGLRYEYIIYYSCSWQLVVCITTGCHRHARALSVVTMCGQG